MFTIFVDYSPSSSTPPPVEPSKKTSTIGERLWAFIEAIGLADLFNRIIGVSRPAAKPTDLNNRVTLIIRPRSRESLIPTVEEVSHGTTSVHKADQEAKKEKARALLKEVKEITKKGKPTISEINQADAKIKEIQGLGIENEKFNIKVERAHKDLLSIYQFAVR